MTWSQELEKWDHLKYLPMSKVVGTKQQRLDALKKDADIYVINRENTEWLINLYGKSWPFDMVVIDELSSFKSNRSKRFKALRKVRPLIKRIVGLTGTPTPNGLIDLWPQMYLLDRGERLGKPLQVIGKSILFQAEEIGRQELCMNIFLNRELRNRYTKKFLTSV